MKYTVPLIMFDMLKNYKYAAKVDLVSTLQNQGSLMSLNIKNKEAYMLASEIAQLTGQRMTAVVINALCKQRQQLQHQQQRKEIQRHELMAIAKRCVAHLQQPGAAVQHGDIFYDEQGLPQ